MAQILRMPSFLTRGRPKPADNWDQEMEAIRAMGEWLSTIDSREAKLRALTYWYWRLKSRDDPRIDKWVEDVAEECAERVGAEVGFTGVKE